MLTPTQYVMDGLAHFYHWKDLQVLDQALWVVKEKSIDMDFIRKWPVRKGFHNEFDSFAQKVAKNEKERA